MMVSGLQNRVRLSVWLKAGAMIALTTSSGLGQEAGFLDMRPGSQPEPLVTGGSADGGGMGCGGCVVMAPLRVEIEHLILIDRGPFPGVEWTIRITNQTKKPIQLPSSLSWSDSVASTSFGRSKFQRIYFGETADCRATGDRAASRAGWRVHVCLSGRRERCSDSRCCPMGDCHG
jgi:hypothetical protein